jgi:hypothetical protein
MNHLEGAETYQDEKTRTRIENWTRFFLRWQKAKLPIVCAIRSDAWRRGSRRCGRVCVESK